jgi:hypothetical protein
MALQVGGWAWVLTAHLVKGLNCWEAFNDFSKQS